MSNWKNNVLVTICAKGNSKGLINKNLKSFFEKPLIYYAIEKALKLNFNYICLSSESNKIINVAKKYGLNVFFKRSSKLSLSNTAKIDVWKDAILKSEKFYGKKFKYFLDIDVTNPMLNETDLKNFLKNFFKKKNLNGQLITTESRKNPYFNMLMRKKNGFQVCLKSKKIYSRQKAPKIYDHVAGFYIFKTKYILNSNWENYLGNKITNYNVPFYKTIDIDTIEDFNITKILFKNILK